jgi:hypothetical protein
MDRDSESIRTVQNADKSKGDVSLVDRSATVFSAASSMNELQDEKLEKPVVYRLYKRRFVGIIGIVSYRKCTSVSIQLC